MLNIFDVTFINVASYYVSCLTLRLLTLRYMTLCDCRFQSVVTWSSPVTTVAASPRTSRVMERMIAATTVMSGRLAVCTYLKYQKRTCCDDAFYFAYNAISEQVKTK